MMRLVRTFRPCGQTLFVPHFCGAKKHLWGQLARHTFYPLIIAATVLLPNFVSGQCYELICNQNVPLKLDATCTGSVNPHFIISNNWSCQGPMDMEYFDAWGTPVGNIVDESYIGQTLDVHVTHNWTGLTCWGTVQVVDVRKPEISFDHVTLNCSEDPSVAAVGTPTATDNCSEVIAFTHQDSVIDFGCGYTGFAGYFAPENWEVCLPNTGDGGVDVSGAPGQVSVEGADSSPQASSPPQVTRFKIEIPTEGYVSFDWSSTGGPHFDNEGFYLTINNWCVQITTDSVQGGSYTTGLLQPGDILSFEQMSNGDAASVNTVVSNFHFHTAAWKVIHRRWAATDEHGNTRYATQVITLNRATLAHVQFPPDRDGISAPMLDCGAAADLSLTGRPFIDEDGDPNTTGDQFDLESGACMLSYLIEDQTVATCEGSELIIRKWTVVDECSSQVLEHTQLIKLFDVTAPTVVCPQGQVISTNNFGCFSALDLPAANATDDCSSTIDIVPHWQYGTGFGPFDEVAVGMYTVTYEATDACGNTGACVTTILVEDAVSPTVICDAQTTASLDADGQAMVYADVVDDGSYDWCCIANYLIKLEGDPDTEYAPTLPVDCADLGQPLMVRLKVTDCYGNANTCDVEVIVQDNFSPVILPPADVTVDCTTDLGDLSVFGEAEIFDNCNFDISETSEESSTGCGESNVVRTWSITDPSGNTVSASQTITLANLNPWNQSGGLITWPPNYQSEECGASLEPWDVPYPYSGPVLAGQSGCESVAVSHSDEVFWVAEPACFKVFRTWKIIDWCQYETNSGNDVGLWEHTQTLEVVDNAAPVFLDPPVEIFAEGGSDCTATVILPVPQLSDCSEHMAITAVGDLGEGFSFANVAAGTYQMTYTAEDGCGNSTSHTFTVSVCQASEPGVSISGFLQTPDGQPVANALVNLSGMPMNPMTTTASGDFVFSDLPVGSDLTIIPAKNTGFLNGVTAYDLVKINDHILGVEPFTTPWQLIAADVNGSGSVTTADMVAVQHLVLFISTEFPNGVPSWQFVPSTHTFADWQNPWGFPVSMSLNNLSEDYPDAHFTGVKIGDVTGNANPLAFGSPQSTVLSPRPSSQRKFGTLKYRGGAPVRWPF